MAEYNDGQHTIQVSLQKSPVTPINVPFRLNTNALNRLLRKLQDRLDLKYLQIADPEGLHRSGFSNRNSRYELYTFIDTHLDMFINRLPSAVKNARGEVHTNIDLKIKVAKILANINELEFNSEVPAMIAEEVDNVYQGMRQMLEVDGYFNSFLFTLEMPDKDQFIRGLQDLMHEALLTHYKEVLADYAQGVAGLSDTDRTPRVVFYKSAAFVPKSLDAFQAALEPSFDRSYMVPWVDQIVASLPGQKPVILHVNDTHTGRQRRSSFSSVTSTGSTGSIGN